MPQSARSAFQLTGLSKNFGTLEALTDLHLDIQQGERIALIGPSGSGKSTLLRVLGAQLRHDKGSLRAGDLEVLQLSQSEMQNFRRHTAFIPQDLALVSALKVSQNVLLGKIGTYSTFKTLRQILWPNAAELESIHQILARVGIGEKLFHSARALSGGQLQRVAIARTLYQGAQTVLADEPVSSIDPTRAHALLSLLRDLNEQEGITLLCSLHNLEYARQYFPRLIGMREGRVIFDGSPESFSQADFENLYTLENRE